MIQRTLQSKLSSLFGNHKALIVMGARQVGKSTLLHSLLENTDNVLWLNGDDIDVQALFVQMTSTRLAAILEGKSIVVIDEAQRIPNIGLRLKLITDQLPSVQVIATGSSSFELANKIDESLTGRKRILRMFPLTFTEMVAHTSLLEEERMLPHRLVYGYYPEVVTHTGEERTILKELTESYLYRDILALDSITKSDKLVMLLKALALQIGSQVSYNELSNLVGIDAKTIEKYIDVLEKSYVVFRLGSFSRNLRNELKFSRKIYFWDTGVRNAVIGSFAQIEVRSDVGALWENWAIAERLKRNAYTNSFAQSYFWRTKQQKEIDYLEEMDGELKAFEFKWNVKQSSTKSPLAFASTYPSAPFVVITPENIYDFLK